MDRKTLGFIAGKLVVLMTSVVAVISVISVIIYQAPVDPASLQFGQRMDSQALDAMRRENFLDQPYSIQLARYLEDLSPLQVLKSSDGRLAHYRYQTLWAGNDRLLILKRPWLRRSYSNGEPVSAMIGEALPATLLLGAAALLIAAIFGLALGMVAALFRDRWPDQLILSATTVLYSVPGYVAAILLALVFGYYLRGWTGLPLQGSVFGLDDFGNDDLQWNKLVLPSLALGLRPVAMIVQMTRSAMLEALSEPYARTASALGIVRMRILFVHAFPNALNPILTTFSGWMASLLTGAFFVEYVFNFRGLGDLTVQALSQFDVPVVLGCCVVTVTIFIAINTLADLAYRWADPRVRI